jgi:hypothetical protein
MKKLLCLILVLCVISPITVTAQSYFTFTSTHDPERISTFTVSENRIEAQGFYRGDRVIAFDIAHIEGGNSVADAGSVALNANADGSYTAVFTGIPPEGTTSNAFRIRVSLQDGGTLNYRVYYNENIGWHFGEGNELGARHGSVVGNYTIMPIAVTAQYLVGADGTRENAETTLNDLRQRALEITFGMDNDYDKARAVSAWVADNIFYDSDAQANADTPELLDATIALRHVMRDLRTICSGFANLTAALLLSLDIKAVTVIGSAVPLSDYTEVQTANRHHEWTAFWYEAEERWVHLDSGWDTHNSFRDGRSIYREAPKRYFDITPAALAQTHRAERAEFRDYFAVLEQHIFTDTSTVAATTSPYNGLPFETTTETTLTSPVTDASTEEDDDLLVLYIIVGVLAVGVVVCGVVVIPRVVSERHRKDEEN